MGRSWTESHCDNVSHISFRNHASSFMGVQKEAQNIFLDCRICLTKTPTQLALLNLSKWRLKGNMVTVKKCSHRRKIKIFLCSRINCNKNQ